MFYINELCLCFIYFGHLNSCLRLSTINSLYTRPRKFYCLCSFFYFFYLLLIFILFLLRSLCSFFSFFYVSYPYIRFPIPLFYLANLENFGLYYKLVTSFWTPTISIFSRYFSVFILYICNHHKY